MQYKRKLHQNQDRLFPILKFDLFAVFDRIAIFIINYLMRKARIKLLEQCKTVKIEESIKLQTIVGTKNHDKYLQIINSIKGSDNSSPEREKLLEKLRKGGFRVDKQRTNKEISINLCTVSKRLDSVVIEVGIGGIFKEIKILIIDTKYKLAERSIVGVGGFGIINPLKIGVSEYVIKTLQFSKQKQVINFIIAEYFYCCIASVLDIGPYLPQNQYDLLCFSDRISFVMEKCQHIKYSPSNFKIQNDLLQSMRCLHQLQIVHRDIKPENIMYSPSKQKAVFIDFGMSKMLEEQIGQLSSTLFVGTYMLVCDEMKKLYSRQCHGEIDLYYNDAYALELSLRNFKKSSEDENMIFSNVLMVSKCESDPIIDSVYVAAKFIYALRFSNLNTLLSILKTFPSFHQLFLYLFSVYCQEQLLLNSVTHPYYKQLKNFQTQSGLDEETLHVLMKILSEIKPQLTKMFLQALQLKQIDKIQQKKVYYQLAEELREEILKTENIDQQFYLECLISSIHNYPYIFSHEDRITFIEAAIRNLLPEISDQNFQKKLFEIYRLMEQVFRKGKKKQKENLKNIRFYYFLNYFKIEYFFLEEFIIDECCENLEEKLEEVILSSMFIFRQENANIFLQKNGPALPYKIKLLLADNEAHISQSENLSILSSILQQLVVVTKHFHLVQTLNFSIKNTFNSIRQILKAPLLNQLFVKQLLDTITIIESIHNFQFIHEYTEIPVLNLFFLKSEVIFKYMILPKLVKFKSYGCINRIIEGNWYLKLLQPKEIIFFYLYKKEEEKAETRLNNQISLNLQQLSFLSQVHRILMEWIEANKTTKNFLKLQSFLFFEILDIIIQLCKDNLNQVTVGPLAFEFLIDNINLVDSIINTFGRMNNDINQEEFKKNVQDRMTQLINLPKLEPQTKMAFEMINRYLEKKPEQRYLVAFEIMGFFNSKSEQIQQMNWFFLKYLCLIWNMMIHETTQEITIRKFIIETVESSQKSEGFKSLSVIPEIILAKAFIADKNYILFLQFFKDLAEKSPVYQRMSLELYKKRFFQNLGWQDLICLKNYFLKTETLQNIKNHGNISLYILIVFKCTYRTMTQKQIRRFLLLVYLSSNQHQINPKLLYFIQWSLVGIWHFVKNFQNKKRSKLIWLRNAVRKSRKISDYEKFLLKEIKRVKRKEVKSTLKSKIKYLKKIKEQLFISFSQIFDWEIKVPAELY